MVSHFLLLALFINVYADVYFKEEFTDQNWEQTWIASEHPSKEWGKFVLSPGQYYGDLNISKGIQTSEDAKFYALSTKFEPFSNKGKVLIVQFSVKHEQDIQCGGGYLKIFDCSLKPKKFHGYSPYLIMFGPDICGSEKQVRVNFNYREKIFKIKKDIGFKDDHLTHLYTLIVKPDNTYAVKIDNKIVTEGKLEEDWNFLPPRKVKDPNAIKPMDSDDNSAVGDLKQEDFDLPEYVPDTEAFEYDHLEEFPDERDLELSLIRNPAYKDRSKQRRRYSNNKESWIHPLIDNPHYIEDPFLYEFDEICGVGFDIWQVNSGTVFDNIFISDNELEAEKHGNETWGFIKDREKEMRKIFLYQAARKGSLSTVKSVKRDEL